MIVKKSLVLIGVENENQKAVLNLERVDDVLKGKIRIYNFPVVPKGILSIGFHNANNVTKAGLSQTSNSTFEFTIDAKNVQDEFSCAVISTFQGDINAILFGNTTGKVDMEKKLSNVMNQNFETEKTTQQVEEILDENKIEYEEEYQEEINSEIEKCIPYECRNCKYKSVFQDMKKQEGLEEKPEKIINQIGTKTFYDQLKPQIDELFSNNCKEEYLQKLIPNSKWVKVEYEDQGEYYILGLIHEDEKLMFVVYGVPGVYSSTPPKEIAGKPVWFPLDVNNPESFGYWLSYQDAETGESIEAFVE